MSSFAAAPLQTRSKSWTIRIRWAASYRCGSWACPSCWPSLRWPRHPGLSFDESNATRPCRNLRTIRCRRPARARPAPSTAANVQPVPGVCRGGGQARGSLLPAAQARAVPLRQRSARREALAMPAAAPRRGRGSKVSGSSSADRSPPSSPLGRPGFSGQSGAGRCPSGVRCGVATPWGDVVTLVAEPAVFVLFLRRQLFLLDGVAGSGAGDERESRIVVILQLAPAPVPGAARCEDAVDPDVLRAGVEHAAAATGGVTLDGVVRIPVLQTHPVTAAVAVVTGAQCLGVPTSGFTRGVFQTKQAATSHQVPFCAGLPRATSGQGTFLCLCGHGRAPRGSRCAQTGTRFERRDGPVCKTCGKTCCQACAACAAPGAVKDGRGRQRLLRAQEAARVREIEDTVGEDPEPRRPAAQLAECLARSCESRCAHIGRRMHDGVSAGSAS